MKAFASLAWNVEIVNPNPVAAVEQQDYQDNVFVIRSFGGI
jgi:hypothetical protein